MPDAPPYAPIAEPPWNTAPPLSPPPPPPVAPGPPFDPGFLPPPPPPSGPPRRRRSITVATVLCVFCALIGFEIGGALFGSPAKTASTARSAVPPAANGSAANTAAPGDIASAVVNINTVLSGGRGAGTGIVLSSDGLVVTNNHVIEGATDIRAQVNGTGPIFNATVLGYSITSDVALIQLQNASGLTTAALGDSSSLKVGDAITALGNALGQGGSPDVSQGRVTALDQTITASDMGGGGALAQTLNGLFEFSAPLVPGDSGGPVVNASGEVVGMNVAASAGGRRRANDAFGIPINTVMDVVHRIEADQSSDQVHIGERAILGIQVRTGRATVISVAPGGPAEAAGISAGDVIKSIDGTAINTVDDIGPALDAHHPGDQVGVEWTDTNGRTHSGTLTLAVGPPA